MTVEYSHAVHSVRPYGLLRLLFRWRGSFYKLIVYQFTTYVLVYSTVLLIYSFVLNQDQRKVFNKLGQKLSGEAHYVITPVIFCISLFMQVTYRRFWAHYRMMAWPDEFAMFINTYVEGKTKEAVLIRRTLVRYAVAAILTTLYAVSPRIQHIFSDDLEDYVKSGFLMEHEAKRLEDIEPGDRHNAILSWSARVIVKCWRVTKTIDDVQGYNILIEANNAIRSRCRRLLMFDMVQTPLALLHTVVFAIYSFFITSALTNTHRHASKGLYISILKDGDRIDEWMVALTGELITVLQFAICNGLVVATTSLMTPFGTNDNAIEVDYIIKRHLSVSYLVADDLYDALPELDVDDDPSNLLSAQSLTNLSQSDFPFSIPKHFKTVKMKKEKLGLRRSRSRRPDIDDKAARRNKNKSERKTAYITEFETTNKKSTRRGSLFGILRYFSTDSAKSKRSNNEDITTLMNE